MIQAPKTLTVDGVEHEVASFSPTVQQLVAIHTEWRSDLARERLKMAKTEAAIRSLDAELTAAVGRELAEKGAAAAQADEPVASAATQ